MDILEEKTGEYLRSVFGASAIQYEPNGRNTFPDFAVNSDILVEATRLNDLIDTPAGVESHSEHYLPFIHGVERMLLDCDLATLEARSYFLNLRLKFPIEKLKAQKSIRTFVKNWCQTGGYQMDRYETVWEGVSCSILVGSVSEQASIHLGGINPKLSGWVVPDTIDQITEAIKKKTPKLETFGHGKPAWLAVGGGASLGFKTENSHFIQEAFSGKTSWRRVIIVNFSDPSKSIDIPFD